MRVLLLLTGVVVVAVLPSASAAQQTVHVVQTCHLDVGFADTAAGILDRYNSYLLNAAATSADFRQHPGKNGEGLIFTTHSYVVSLLFDCVPGFGYKCYNETEKTIVADAIKMGDIVMQVSSDSDLNAELTVIETVAGLPFQRRDLDAEQGSFRVESQSDKHSRGSLRGQTPEHHVAARCPGSHPWRGTAAV